MQTPVAIGYLKRGWSVFWVEVACLVATGCGGQTRATADASATPEATAEGGFAREAAGSCPIDTSTYNHSCNVDSDCVLMAMGLSVASVDYCRPSCLCPNDAINRDAAQAFASAVLHTPLGSGAFRPAPCNCANLASCCIAGRCSIACVTQTPCGGSPCPSGDGEAGPGPTQDAE
jgi:hypothetical protein